MYIAKGRCSIVVSIPACHAGDPGSIPGNGESSSFFATSSSLPMACSLQKSGICWIDQTCAENCTQKGNAISFTEKSSLDMPASYILVSSKGVIPIYTDLSTPTPIFQKREPNNVT